MAISLVGPASNFLLYFLFTGLSEVEAVRTNPFVYEVTWTLAWANGWMGVFNLLPAFPLDGGKALEALLGKFLTFLAARRVVGVLGLCVAAYCVYLGLNGNSWMLVLALMLGLENYEAVQGANNPPWQKWN
jgi:Zn-dependent protease